jgi:hypothetical protein
MATRIKCVFCKAPIDLVTAEGGKPIGLQYWQHSSESKCKKPRGLGTRVWHFLMSENLYCRSELIEMINSGELIGKKINFSTKSAAEVANWLRGAAPSEDVTRRIEILRDKIARLHGELGAAKKELRRLQLSVVGAVS